MSEGMKQKRSLSVSHRLLTLGGAALIGFSAMIGVGWYQSATVGEVLARGQDIGEKVAIVNGLRVANLDLVLAAMDSIVDRDDGVVAPERIEIMKKSLAELRDKAPVIENITKIIGKPELSATLRADIDEMERATLTDLPNLVTSKAADDEFGKIDDAIDGAGERISLLLGGLADSGVTIAADNIHSARDASVQSFYWQVGLGAAGMLVLVLLFALHSTAIRRGVFGIRDSLNRMLNEDFDTPVDGKDRGDEFGEMAVAAEALRQSSIEKRNMTETGRRERERNDADRAAREAAKLDEDTQIRFAVDTLGAGLNKLANGDLTVTLPQPFRADLEQVRGDFNRAVAKLQQVLGDVSTNTSSIDANSAQMRNAAEDLAKRTEQQAASLEETSAALEQITSTVKNSSARAAEAMTMVGGTKASAEESSKVVAEAMEAMSRIEDASSEIGKIINVIDEIAFQTNLLALNAGVEAARAGEAGKGFAVVAQEVRELAQRSAGAAKEIKDLINTSAEQVQHGVHLVGETGEALKKIEEEVRHISGQIGRIAEAASEQSAGLGQINTAIDTIDQNTQRNAAMVEEATAAVHSLAGEATKLEGLLSRFNLGTGATIPAARRAA